MSEGCFGETIRWPCSMVLSNIKNLTIIHNPSLSLVGPLMSWYHRKMPYSTNLNDCTTHALTSSYLMAITHDGAVVSSKWTAWQEIGRFVGGPNSLIVHKTYTYLFWGHLKTIFLWLTTSDSESSRNSEWYVFFANPHCYPFNIHAYPSPCCLTKESSTWKSLRHKLRSKRHRKTKRYVNWQTQVCWSLFLLSLILINMHAKYIQEVALDFQNPKATGQAKNFHGNERRKRCRHASFGVDLWPRGWNETTRSLRPTAEA